MNSTRSINLRRLVPSVGEPWTRIDRSIYVGNEKLTRRHHIVQWFINSRGRGPIGHGLSYIEESGHPATTIDKNRR